MEVREMIKVGNFTMYNPKDVCEILKIGIDKCNDIFNSPEFPCLTIGRTRLVSKESFDRFVKEKDLSDSRKGWRRNLKENTKITKGMYVIKVERFNKDLPICDTCKNCNNKEFCQNRTNTKLMRKCGDCKNCENLESCDKFYKSIQFKTSVIVGRDSKGNPIRKSFSSSSEEEAIFKAIQFKKDCANGITKRIVRRAKSIYEMAIKNEEDKLRSGEIRESTYLRNKEVIKRFENAPWAKEPIDKVTREDLEEFLIGERMLSNSTIFKEYHILKKVYSIAIYEGYVQENYFEGYHCIKVPKSIKDDKEVSALTLDEENIFINYILSSGALYKNIYLIALYTGLRGGEIFALTRNDIDLKNKLLTINKTVSVDINGNPVIGKTKTSNGKRTIVINSKCEPVLKEAIANMIPNDKNLLFCKEDGSIINRSMTNSELRRICEKLKIKKVSLHALRHTFATRCVEAGINLKAIQGFLGHADIQTTMNIYAEAQDDFKRNEMAKFDRYAEGVI